MFMNERDTLQIEPCFDIYCDTNNCGAHVCMCLPRSSWLSKK